MSLQIPKKHYYQGNLLLQLRGFCYTVQLGSLSKAATFLNTSHSAVSLQIKALEMDFKAELIRRHGPKIQITDAGRLLYELAYPHIGGIDELRDQFAGLINQHSELKISANQSALNYILPCVLRKYFKTNPQVDVIINYEEYEVALSNLISEAIDIAILPRRYHVLVPGSIEFIHTTTFPVSLITLKNHPLAGISTLTLDQIATYELILPAPNLRVVPMLYDKFQDFGLLTKTRVRFANCETSRKFVEQGLGINISSEIVIEPDHPILCATPLSHIFPPVDYGCFIKRGKPLSNAGNALIDHMKAFDITTDFRFFPSS